MRRSIQIILRICICLLFISMGVNGQNNRFFNSEQGLSSSLIHKVSQDDHGYIWIASENGVCYFDGIRFHVFHHENNKKGTLTNNLVKIVYTDSKGVCWIGTSTGLQVYDYENNIFNDFDLQYPEFKGVPYVTSIIEIKEQNKLMLSVSGLGILVYDADNHKIDLEYTEKLKKLYNTNFIGHLYLDTKGFLWSYSEQGSFFRLDIKSKKLYQLTWPASLFEKEEKVIVSTLFEDNENHNILIGTYKNGLFIYDSGLRTIRKPKGKIQKELNIRSILVEKQNHKKIWIGTENIGLQLFDRDNEMLINPDLQCNSIDLNNCKVHSLMQDTQGNIWAGIFQKGLLLIPQSNKNFEHIKLSENQSSAGLNVASITSIIRDNNDELWIGTDGGGLFNISKNGSQKCYTRSNTPLPNNSILSLEMDKRGVIWISTYMGGITSYSPEYGFKSFCNNIEVQRVIYSMYDKKEDKLYMGTLGYGVQVLSFSDHTVSPLYDFNKLAWVNSVCKDNSGNVWIGKTDGLLCYNEKKEVEIKKSLTHYFEGIRITTCYIDNIGNLWIGTSQGLYYVNIESEEIKVYTTNEGLSGNCIAGVIQDKNNILWISTTHGLSKLNVCGGEFVNYFAYDGLQDNEFSERACFNDSGGNVYFGGINGINTFKPENITNIKKPISKIYFSQLSVLNKVIHYDNNIQNENILDSHISQAHQIILEKKQNVFSLEFTVLEYANPQKVVYGYKLDGFDEEWRYTDYNNSKATYTNLPDGDYTLNIKAFYNGTTEEKDVVFNKINIKILPPWYKTGVAQALYFVLFLCILWVLQLFLRKKRNLEQERLELEKKEMELRMFTNLSHEIKTPLTLLYTPLQAMQESETDIKRKETFNLMHRNAHRILQLVNQLMDIRKIDNHQLKMKFQKTDLIPFIEDIIKSFEPLLMSGCIDFKLVSDIKNLDVWIDQNNFDKVLFNILSNAFKFTPDNGTIFVYVDVVVKKSQKVSYSGNIECVEIIVENSGAKINENEINRIFDRFYQCEHHSNEGGSGIGLHLSRMIVQLHHGTITAKNIENGVSLVICIPLGNKHLKPSEIALEKTSKNKSVAEKFSVLQNSEFYLNANNNVKYRDFENRSSKQFLVFIDDDADLGEYIKIELSDKYYIRTYVNAERAWKDISTEIPDVVVTDLVMPEIDGISLCQKIRKNPNTKHIPVMIITSQCDQESERLCIQNGVDYYLTKPIDLQILKSIISQLLYTRDILKNKYSLGIKTDLTDIKLISPDNNLVSRVIDLVQKNIENPEFSVDDLSREVGLSRVHLNRKLKEKINISPGNLIKSIRLKQAAYLLIYNKVNISDIAYTVRM